MKGRAVVIKTVGDHEIADAIMGGIVDRRPTAEELSAVKAELEAMKRREAALAVRQIRDKEYYYCKAKEAEYYYGDNPTHSKPAEILLGIIGLICEAINSSYRYLSAWNREG